MMVSAIGSGTSAATASGTTAPAKRTPSLDAELNTARARLEDWITCPSARTPEGKAKIKEVTAQFDSIKAQIAKEAKTADLDTPAAVRPASDTPTADRPNPAIGGNVDIWA